MQLTPGRPPAPTVGSATRLPTRQRSTALRESPRPHWHHSTRADDGRRHQVPTALSSAAGVCVPRSGNRLGIDVSREWWLSRETRQPLERACGVCSWVVGAHVRIAHTMDCAYTGCATACGCAYTGCATACGCGAYATACGCGAYAMACGCGAYATACGAYTGCAGGG